ncbi:MAG: NIPSNAP family protein [Alphaproteobacteria bacterium]|nr:NIPSNAP family protein [Alphaproteobacteria bacterium]
MVVEQRTYKIRNGKLAQYLSLIRDEGIAIQQPILGNLIGYFQTEIGPLSHIVHMWGYKDLNDRAERRAKLAADPRWKAFTPKIAELIETAESRILLPTDFSPLR